MLLRVLGLLVAGAPTDDTPLRVRPRRRSGAGHEKMASQAKQGYLPMQVAIAHSQGTRVEVSFTRLKKPGDFSRPPGLETR